ncbi:MAG: sulfite exporter TauE/SafE family protein [Chloroflexota bacterium]
MDWLLLGTMLGSGVIIGGLGVVLGIGGGALMVPLLSVGLGVPVQSAVAASLTSIIATSSAGAGFYLRRRLANPRLAITLGVGTTFGGIVGGLIGVSVGRELLTLLFALALLAVAVLTWIRRHEGEHPMVIDIDEGQLGDTYYDQNLHLQVRYRIRRLPQGLGMSLFAGLSSGLLGIGGGVINVPSMVFINEVPVKAAVATSNLMLGFTAAVSAAIYYSAGFLDVRVTTAVTLGVFIGSFVGARRVPRLRIALINDMLAVLFVVVAFLMLLHVAGYY